MQNIDIDAITDDELGLSFLMNSKKKTSSDALSISSGRSSLIDQEEGSVKSIRIKPDVINVSDHLSQEPYHSTQKQSYQKQNYENSQESSEADSNYDDDESNYEEDESRRDAPRQRRMTEEEILNQKKELLYQFERLEKKGMRLPKRFTLASPLEEMKMEYERLKRDREVDGSIKFQRRMTMAAVSGVEFLSTNYLNFLGAKLDGWSEKMYEDIDDYDDIFEELHEKYKGRGKIAPELRLVAGIGGSALMFHMTNRYSSTLPGLEQVLKTNPELARKLAEATMESQQQQQSTSTNFFGNLFGGMFNPPQQHQSMPPNPPPPQHQKVKLRGPSSQNIEDILADLERSTNNDRIETISVISETDMTDDVESSINGILMGDKRRKKGLTLDL
jgi:hypothetical protein